MPLSVNQFQNEFAERRSRKAARRDPAWAAADLEQADGAARAHGGGARVAPREAAHLGDTAALHKLLLRSYLRGTLDFSR